MRNILLTIAYDGAGYNGWQLQPNQPTVQGAIEQRLQQITQKTCRLRVAGRTDAGVHADAQLASFLAETALPCGDLMHGLNALLPPDIRIWAARDVALDFEPRHGTQGKHYRYQIFNRWLSPPPDERRVYHVRRPLDLVAMATAGWQLVGTHDFSAFRAADCERASTRRTIFRCSICHRPPYVLVDVHGTAFLKQMVRIIAGTLVDVGSGRLPVDVVSHLLARGDRTEAGTTAPAHALSLVEVFLP